MSTTSVRHDPVAVREAIAGGDYSLMLGGATYRFVGALLRRVPRRLHPGGLISALALVVSFVPPLLLSWRDGALFAGDTDLPLSQDWFVMARFVVAMPLLILGAELSDRLLRSATRQFWAGGAITQAMRNPFVDMLSRVARWRDASWPEVACLLLALTPVLLPALTSSMTGTEGVGGSTWAHAPDGTSSAAGAWVEGISAPLFRFLVLLWLWRLLLWTWILLRCSRMPLDLRASHPDGAGGLAFLGLAQCRFAVLSAAGAVLVCGYALNQMVHAGESVQALRFLIAGYVAGATLALLAPLLLLSPAMVRAKRGGLETYATLGHAASQAFEAKWLPSSPGPGRDAAALIDSPHPSAVADFGGVYAAIQSMAIVPVTRWHILRLILATLLPFTPIAFFAMPLDELVQHIFQILV